MTDEELFMKIVEVEDRNGKSTSNIDKLTALEIRDVSSFDQINHELIDIDIQFRRLRLMVDSITDEEMKRRREDISRRISDVRDRVELLKLAKALLT